MLLRPHHLQCIKYFVGNGYSNQFTNNMNEIINTINNGEPIEIVFGMDSICSCCPNNDNGVCLSENKVTRYDKAIADYLKIKEHVSYRNLFLDENKLNVCKDCEWHNLCLEIERRKK